MFVILSIEKRRATFLHDEIPVRYYNLIVSVRNSLHPLTPFQCDSIISRLTVECKSKFRLSVLNTYKQKNIDVK